MWVRYSEKEKKKQIQGALNRSMLSLNRFSRDIECVRNHLKCLHLSKCNIKTDGILVVACV